MFSLYMKGAINNMELLEKIILTILVYLLIGIFGLGAAISYLMLNDIGAMMMCLIVLLLFYTLGLIEEQ